MDAIICVPKKGSRISDSFMITLATAQIRMDCHVILRSRKARSGAARLPQQECCTSTTRLLRKCHACSIPLHCLIKMSSIPIESVESETRAQEKDPAISDGVNAVSTTAPVSVADNKALTRKDYEAMSKIVKYLTEYKNEEYVICFWYALHHG